MGETRTISQWGNSLGLRIPNQVFKQTNLKARDVVEITVEDDDTLVLTRTGDTDKR